MKRTSKSLGIAASLLVAGVITICVTSASANDLPTTDRSIEEFINPDGSFDLEAARLSGYEGSLDMEGFVTKLSASADSTYIVITSPNGGTEWLVGTAHDIEWTEYGNVGPVDIYWSRDGFTFDSTLVVNDHAGDSPFNWSVPSNSASSTVTFRVYGNNDNVYATSEEMTFSGVRVTSPVTGNLAQGASTSINWMTIGTLVGSSFDIDLVYDTSGHSSPWIRLASGVSGGWWWDPIPPPPTEQAWIRIKKAGTMTGIGQGGPFSISGLVVKTPNGGEVWDVGTTHEIEWSVVNPSDVGNITIQLFKNPGAAFFYTIASGVDAADTTWAWTIPQTQVRSTNYYIKIFADAEPTIMDVSNAYFTVPPNVTLTSPNGGETLVSGSPGTSYNITWIDNGRTENVKLEYTLDANAGTPTWFNIAGAGGIAPGTNFFVWTLDTSVDTDLCASAYCLIRVSEISGANPVSDASDAWFEIQGGECSCTHWTPGLDTVLYTAFEVELFDPNDSTGSLGSIVAFGADMLVQRSAPYEASLDIWRMDTEIQAFSGSGDSPLLGGAFTIDLNPQESSGGYIQMCESCNDNWAESHFDINYRINTSLPFPENMLYGVALMDLPCNEQWDPVTPPHGHDYIDPRKLPIIDANGDTVGYTQKRHRVDEDPFGSCCVLETNQDQVTGACLIVTEVECEAAGGVYYGDNSICDPDGNDYDLDGIGDSCDQCDDFPPVIADVGDTVFVQFYAPFSYYPEIVDPDNATHAITYTEYPHWCTIRNDSVIGLAADSAHVEPLTFIVQDTCNADTVSFIVAIYLCGNVNGDESEIIDISDLLYLIDYMFNGGPPPPVMTAANVNGYGGNQIDISDLLYLIDYMFNDGPPPVCP